MAKKSNNVDFASSSTVPGPHFQDLFKLPVVRTNGKGITVNDVKDIPVWRKIQDGSWDTSLMPNVAKYSRLTPIQQYALPIGNRQLDVIGCAVTGSGKTAAYLLPVLNKLLENEHYKRGKAVRTCQPVALVMAPTRELALQIFEYAKRLADGTAVKVGYAYGGLSRAEVVETCDGVDLLVACADGLRELMVSAQADAKDEPGWTIREESQMLAELHPLGVDLSIIEYLVLDEADKLMQHPGLKWLLSKSNLSPAPDRQSFLFSATFSKDKKCITKYLKLGGLTDRHVIVEVGRPLLANPNVEQILIQVREGDKFDVLLNLLSLHSGRVIVFVSTRVKADKVTLRLRAPGCRWEGKPKYVDILHMSHKKCKCPRNKQADREAALTQLRTEPNSVMVATNVAGRGLDIHGLDLIIYYDTPWRQEDYINGIGRTGRTGNNGRSILFYDNGPESKDYEKAQWIMQTVKQVGQEVPDWLIRDSAVPTNLARLEAPVVKADEHVGHFMQNAMDALKIT